MTAQNGILCILSTCKSQKWSAIYCFSHKIFYKNEVQSNFFMYENKLGANIKPQYRNGIPHCKYITLEVHPDYNEGNIVRQVEIEWANLKPKYWLSH